MAQSHKTQSHKNSEKTLNYKVGDFDKRPWGAWLVTHIPSGAAQTEAQTKRTNQCEKVIVVEPKKILSLQSHKLRHEKWTVLDGQLEAIIDGRHISLKSGQSIEVPVGAPHCMANLGDIPAIVKEEQSGTCRETDIIRYLDAYGRSTTPTKNERIEKSVSLYNALRTQADKGTRKYA